MKLSGADLFVEILNLQGVEYIFYNPGFDVVPLLSAIARYKVNGRPAPQPIMCLDEFTALNAAHGNYMVTGKPQVLLVHAELGTQQVGGAIQQAWYGKVPVIICAADMIASGRLNWRGEPYDQGAMLRNCVKWDHRISPQDSFYEILSQAFGHAISEPSGPVYVTYPIEILNKQYEISTMQKVVKNPLPPLEPGFLEKAADILLQAENPLIMTGYCGRNPASVPLLIDLAENLGARVVTSGLRMNFPSNHPLCATLEPNDGLQTKPYYLSADAMLVIDYDIPYAYPRTPPRAETKFIHIDIDFIKQGEILWKRQPDIAIPADSCVIIPQLAALIRAKCNAEQRIKIQKRSEKIERENNQLRREWLNQGHSAGKGPGISAEWLAFCLNKVLDEDSIVINQTITPSAAVARQIVRNQPGNILSCAGGTIGWALGATLGAKVAAPGKLVAGLMGDGAFVYGGPTASLWPAAYYQAPFLVVIFNNQGYGAIKKVFQGDWKEGIEYSEIAPSPSYAMTAQACGAYGCMVDKADELLPVLQQAIQKVRSGQAAVVDVRLI
jgi:acetolactate synthase I/II/III large subunit